VTDYRDLVQRRWRRARRSLLDALGSVTDRSALRVGTYWWDSKPNFGDALTSWLLRQLGLVTVYAPPDRAVLVGVGSILEHLPCDYSGIVWGSGLMHDQPLRLPAADVMAVRGQLTRSQLGLDETMRLGDPGLLAPMRIPRQSRRWDVGIIPHRSHQRHPLFTELSERLDHAARFIDVRRSPGRVVREVSSCGVIVTSSLHGLVVADAYGIPALWTTASPPLLGGNFKFRDHESAVLPGGSRYVDLRGTESLAHLRDSACAASPERVEHCSVGLIDAARALRRHLEARQVRY
jgi:hypothetical protein